MKIEIEVNDEELFFLKQYSDVYDKERDIDFTYEPIVIVEDIEEIVTKYGFEDDVVYVYDGERYGTEDELVLELKRNNFSYEEIETITADLHFHDKALNNRIKKFYVIYRYKPVAYFLTRCEAEKYCEYQKHNLNKPRVYSRGIGYSNNGDMKSLNNLLLKIGDSVK